MKSTKPKAKKLTAAEKEALAKQAAEEAEQHRLLYEAAKKEHEDAVALKRKIATEEKEARRADELDRLEAQFKDIAPQIELHEKLLAYKPEVPAYIPYKESILVDREVLFQEYLTTVIDESHSNWQSREDMLLPPKNTQNVIGSTVKEEKRGRVPIAYAGPPLPAPRSPLRNAFRWCSRQLTVAADCERMISEALEADDASMQRLMRQAIARLHQLTRERVDSATAEILQYTQEYAQDGRAGKELLVLDAFSANKSSLGPQANVLDTPFLHASLPGEVILWSPITIPVGKAARSRVIKGLTLEVEVPKVISCLPSSAFRMSVHPSIHHAITDLELFHAASEPALPGPRYCNKFAPEVTVDTDVRSFVASAIAETQKVRPSSHMAGGGASHHGSQRRRSVVSAASVASSVSGGMQQRLESEDEDGDTTVLGGRAHTQDAGEAGEWEGESKEKELEDRPPRSRRASLALMPPQTREATTAGTFSSEHTLSDGSSGADFRSSSPTVLGPVLSLELFSVLPTTFSVTRKDVTFQMALINNQRSSTNRLEPLPHPAGGGASVSAQLIRVKTWTLPNHVVLPFAGPVLQWHNTRVHQAALELAQSLQGTEIPANTPPGVRAFLQSPAFFIKTITDELVPASGATGYSALAGAPLPLPSDGTATAHTPGTSLFSPTLSQTLPGFQSTRTLSMTLDGGLGATSMGKTLQSSMPAFTSATKHLNLEDLYSPYELLTLGIVNTGGLTVQHWGRSASRSRGEPGNASSKSGTAAGVPSTTAAAHGTAPATAATVSPAGGAGALATAGSPIAGHHWSSHGINEVEWDPTHRNLSFSTISLAPHAIRTSPTIDFPYTSWTLTPTAPPLGYLERMQRQNIFPSACVFTLSTGRGIPISILCTHEGVQLLKPQYPELGFLLTAPPMKVIHLLYLLQLCGIFLLPKDEDLNATNYQMQQMDLPPLKPVPKDFEQSLYYDLAQCSAAFAFLGALNKLEPPKLEVEPESTTEAEETDAENGEGGEGIGAEGGDNPDLSATGNLSTTGKGDTKKKTAKKKGKKEAKPPPSNEPPVFVFEEEPEPEVVEPYALHEDTHHRVFNVQEVLVSPEPYFPKPPFTTKIQALAKRKAEHKTEVEVAESAVDGELREIERGGSASATEKRSGTRESKEPDFGNTMLSDIDADAPSPLPIVAPGAGASGEHEPESDIGGAPWRYRTQESVASLGMLYNPGPYSAKDTGVFPPASLSLNPAPSAWLRTVALADAAAPRGTKFVTMVDMAGEELDLTREDVVTERTVVSLRHSLSLTGSAEAMSRISWSSTRYVKNVYLLLKFTRVLQFSYPVHYGLE